MGASGTPVLHCDLNNFFASVECARDPSLRGRPVIVGGSASERHGIVLAKSYEAKRYGVKTGETLWQARLKCPEAVVVPPHFDSYLACSKQVRDIYYRYTNQVEPFGLDECWLDVAGSEHLYGDSLMIADRLRHEVEREAGVTISVGVSFTKVFAKLASDEAGRSQIYRIGREDWRELVWPMEAGRLLFVGRTAQRELGALGMRTIGDLAAADPDKLRRRLGIGGLQLHTFANGGGDSTVADFFAKREIKSVGNSMTLPRDLLTEEEALRALLLLSETVAGRLRRYGLRACGVQMGVKDSAFRRTEAQKQLTAPALTSEELYRAAAELFRKDYAWDAPVRAVGVRAIRLVPADTPIQTDFFTDHMRIDRRERLEGSVDKLRARYGREIVQRASLLASPELVGAERRKQPGLLPNAVR